MRVRLLGTGLSVPRASGGPLFLRQGRPSQASQLPQGAAGQGGCEAARGVTFDRGALSLLRGLAVQSARNQEGIHHGSFTPVQMCLFSSTPGVGRICTCE